MQLMSITTGLLCVLLLKTHIREKGDLGGEAPQPLTRSYYLEPTLSKKRSRATAQNGMWQKFFRLLYHRQNPQSSSGDVTKVRFRTFFSYHMKLSVNESLHCTDYEMVCDRNFFGCCTPDGRPQSSSYDVTAKMTS